LVSCKAYEVRHVSFDNSSVAWEGDDVQKKKK
jgi:hypothetical protein